LKQKIKDMKRLLVFGLICLSLVSCSVDNNIDFLDMKSMSDGDTIVIQGLGEYNQDDIKVIQEVIERRCHIPTKIGEPITLTSDFYYDGLLNIDKCSQYLDNKINKIMVTNSVCYSTVHERKVGGIGEFNGNCIIIGKNSRKTLERVLIHEMGHCLGFNHCENPTCVMSDTRENDNLKLNFCEDCQKKF